MSDAHPKGSVWPTWTKVLLFVSLAVNLLIAGIVIGAVVRHGDVFRQEGPKALPMRQFGYGPFGDALTRPERRALARSVRQHSDELKFDRTAFRKDMGKLLGALRAPQFDRAVAESILADQQQKLFERQVVGRKILLDQIEAMTPAERKAYADRLERLLRRR